MNAQARRVRFDRAAGRLAVVGAGLGVLAGSVDVAAGASIRSLVGNKLDTTTLGFATIALSGIALAAALAWARPGRRDGGRRLGTLIALVVPAAICFTTIGQLWYLPGVLLLGASMLIGATTNRGELAGAVDEQRWLQALIVVLGGYYLFLGADAHGIATVLGILGGLAIWVAVVAARRSHRFALSLLVVGTLPFALATWWSVVTPVVAVLVLLLARPAIGRGHPDGPEASWSTSRMTRRRLTERVGGEYSGS